MKTKFIKWLGVLLIGMMGCYDYSNFDNFAIDPVTTSYVFPVLNDSIALQEILDKTDSVLIVENLDHSYSLIYRDTIDAGDAADHISIPNQNFNYTLTIPGLPVTPVSIPSVSYPFNQEAQNSIQTSTEAGGTVELKGIDFTAGTINIHVVNNFNHIIDGNITFSSLINKQNNPLVLKVNLNTYGATKDTIINLADYHLNAYHASLNAYNYFYYQVNGTLTTTNGSVNAGDNISIQVSAINPTFLRVTGKINYTFTQNNQSFNVDFFPTNIDVQQHLEDPKLNFKFINSFGVPLSVNFTEFELNNKQNTPFNLTSSRTNPGDLQIPNKINIIPSIKRVNQPDTTITYALNKDNSNIASAFDNIPTSINFGADFVSGDASTNHDYFINHNSTLKLISEAEIPLYGWVEISMKDSVTSLDLPKLKDLDVTNAKVALSLKIYNSIPFDVFLQVAFVDETTNTTTLLFENKVEEQLILSPTVGIDGTSNQTAAKTTLITIDKAKYDLISNATKMKMNFRFALGKVGQSVKVLSTNKLRIKANFYVSGTVKPKL